MATLESVFKKACINTDKNMLSILDRAADIRSCIDYFSGSGSPSMQLPFQYDKKKFISKPIIAVSDEGLLWVKVNDRDVYIKIGQHSIEKTLDVFSRWIGKFPNAQEQYDEKRLK